MFHAMVSASTIASCQDADKSESRVKVATMTQNGDESARAACMIELSDLFQTALLILYCNA